MCESVPVTSNSKTMVSGQVSQVSMPGSPRTGLRPRGDVRHSQLRSSCESFPSLGAQWIQADRDYRSVPVNTLGLDLSGFISRDKMGITPKIAP
jgi:hypothetical protein